MKDPSRVQAAELLAPLIDLIAEISVDRAVREDDITKRLKYALAQAGKRRARNIEETAEIMDRARTTVKNWGFDCDAPPPVTSIWDMIRSEFDGQESWTLESLHSRLKEAVRGRVDGQPIRQGTLKMETVKWILLRLVESGDLERSESGYRKVVGRATKEDQVPRTIEQYREFVDYRIARWSKVAQIHRNPSKEDIADFCQAKNSATRTMGPTSYVAHDCRISVPSKGYKSAHEQLAKVIDKIRKAVESQEATEPSAETVPVHFQILYSILESDDQLFA